MASKPSIPKGTRDFHLLRWQKTIYHTNYKIGEIWFSTHRNAFIRKLETLMGKWGGGDRLILRF
jgi:hypothetical protein